mgnify:FL=1
MKISNSHFVWWSICGQCADFAGIFTVTSLITPYRAKMSQPIKAQYLTLGLRYEILHDVESFQILSATEF